MHKFAHRVQPNVVSAADQQGRAPASMIARI
jgi:hypothetical protein